MSYTPKISIIVPVYMSELYLPQCIDSILTQTFTDFELLLIDDGSPDCCGKICEDYAKVDDRIRVYHQKNAGVSTARNKGLTEALGRYIVFVDSDDYVLPEYIEALYNELPEGEGNGVVIESVVKLDFNGHMDSCSLPDLNLSSKDRFRILTDLVGNNIGYSSSKIYCKDIIDRYNLSFLSTISLLEDLFFLLDYIQYADFVLIRNISNYIYRVDHSDSAQSVSYKSLREECDIFHNYYARIIQCQQEFRLKKSTLKPIWNHLKIFFHRILLVLYTTSEKTSYEKRRSLLSYLMLTYSDWIKYEFMPDYLSDRIAKFLLLHRFYLCFDIWMRFLVKINFKYMFGSKNKRK